MTSASQDRPAVATILGLLNEERRRRGLSVEALAQRMDVSPPTMSRWLRGRGLTLVALDELCRQMDIDLRDLIDRSDEEGADSLTLRQERILAADRDMSLVFFLTLNGAQPDTIARDFRMPRERLDSAIARLERLDLIRITRGGSVRPTTSRSVSWRPGGPLAVAFDRTVKPQFMSADFGAPDARYVAQLLWLDQNGRRLVQERFRTLCQDILLASRGAEDAGEGEWSAVFMMTRPVAPAEMVTWTEDVRDPEAQ